VDNENLKLGIACLLGAAVLATAAANGYHLGLWQNAMFGGAFVLMAGMVYFFSR
jgi:hypothetical protein